jgi:hypothetical protein
VRRSRRAVLRARVRRRAQLSVGPLSLTMLATDQRKFCAA